MTELSPHLQSAMQGALVNIGILFDISDTKKFMAALKRVERRAVFWVEDEMQRLCAIELSHQIIANIYGAKYGASPVPNPPYHPRYARWKRQYFPEKMPWRLKNDLVANIRAFPVPTIRGIGKDWMAGVPEGVFDSGGKSWLGMGDIGPAKSIAMYGKKAEEKRPLFEPTQDEYAKGPWLEKGEQTLRTIAEGWR